MSSQESAPQDTGKESSEAAVQAEEEKQTDQPTIAAAAPSDADLHDSPSVETPHSADHSESSEDHADGTAKSTGSRFIPKGRVGQGMKGKPPQKP